MQRFFENNRGKFNTNISFLTDGKQISVDAFRDGWPEVQILKTLLWENPPVFMYNNHRRCKTSYNFDTPRRILSGRK